MKIAFKQMESGYFSLYYLLEVKGLLKNGIAEIPPGYLLVTDGDLWNIEKTEETQTRKEKIATQALEYIANKNTMDNLGNHFKNTAKRALSEISN